MKQNSSLQLRTSLKQRIILVIFGVLLFFVLLETALRLGGFILLSIQEHRNLQSIKQKGAYRIMCLGESTTQGEYPQFIEQALNQRNPEVRFSVIDKGRKGTNTPEILSQIEANLDQYYPDMVVTMMGINDAGEHIPFEIATTSKAQLFIRSFKIYKLARLLWLHILAKAKEVGFYKPNGDSRSSGKAQTYFSGIEPKESPDESMSTESSLKKAPELNPKNGNTYVKLGGVYRDQGQNSQAEKAFKKALELNPKNDNAYVGLGWLYRYQDRLFEAEDALKKAIELNPKNYKAYVELGWLYRYHYWPCKISQAEGAFNKARELNFGNDSIYFELGGIYRYQGKFLQAEEAFKKAIELNPENELAYRGLATIYDEMGKRKLSDLYVVRADKLRSGYYLPVTVDNYRKLKAILDKRRIKLVCVQYPMRNVEALKKIFRQDEGVIFVDNESVFKEALKGTSYKEYFRDMFGGDFGHCTDKGNRLLGQNIAEAILKNYLVDNKISQ